MSWKSWNLSIPKRLKARDGAFAALCSGQSKPRGGARRSLSVEMASGLWVCFRCDAKGKLREKREERPLERNTRMRQIMRAAFGLNSPVTTKGIAETLATSTLTLSQTSADQVAPEVVSSDLRSSWRHSLRGLLSPADSPGQAYLEGRGLPLSLRVEAKVKWAPSWLGRPAVVFPIYDMSEIWSRLKGAIPTGVKTPKLAHSAPKSKACFCRLTSGRRCNRARPLLSPKLP